MQTYQTRAPNRNCHFSQTFTQKANTPPALNHPTILDNSNPKPLKLVKLPNPSAYAVSPIPDLTAHRPHIMVPVYPPVMVPVLGSHRSSIFQANGLPFVHIQLLGGPHSGLLFPAETPPSSAFWETTLSGFPSDLLGAPSQLPVPAPPPSALDQ